MFKLFLTLALAGSLLLVAGCATKSGSREYAPGQGWQQN
jgi:hypothetical protein